MPLSGKGTLEIVILVHSHSKPLPNSNRFVENICGIDKTLENYTKENGWYTFALLLYRGNYIDTHIEYLL